MAMFRRLRCIPAPKYDVDSVRDPALAAVNLLGTIQDGLDEPPPQPAPLRASQAIRSALGQAHTGQVVSAVHAQLAAMQIDWARRQRVPHLVIQARVLLQLLAELGDFPAGHNPDVLASQTGPQDQTDG